MTRPPQRPGRPAHDATRFLLDLVNDHLDPGYAAAAKRRGAQVAPAGRFDRPAVALGALLIGFVLVLAYVHTNRGAPAAQRVHDGLVQRVRSAQDGADDLAQRLDQTERSLAAAQRRVLPAGGLAGDVARAQLAAGQVAVRGPGLVVTLTEPSAPTPTPSGARGGTVPAGATHILFDRDVRSVVNELWADGAEAVAVNGVRLTPTSAIRFAGEAVLVDFQPVTSPYRIEAIGDADNLSTNFAQSEPASRYQTLSSAEHVGFTFQDEDDISLPASAPVSTRYAHPVRPSATRSTR